MIPRRIRSALCEDVGAEGGTGIERAFACEAWKQGGSTAGAAQCVVAARAASGDVPAKKRPPERSRSQGGGEPEPFPGAIGRCALGRRCNTGVLTNDGRTVGMACWGVKAFCLPEYREVFASCSGISLAWLARLLAKLSSFRNPRPPRYARDQTRVSVSHSRSDKKPLPELPRRPPS
jgi:hypothetical protein